MEYQRLKNSTNQPCKCRTRNWVEINDKARGTYDYNRNIKFKTSTIRLNLCDYSNTYIQLKPTKAVPNTAAADAPVNNINKKVIF